jgi:hypothetical protein
MRLCSGTPLASSYFQAKISGNYIQAGVNLIFGEEMNDAESTFTWFIHVIDSQMPAPFASL